MELKNKDFAENQNRMKCGRNKRRVRETKVRSEINFPTKLNRNYVTLPQTSNDCSEVLTQKKVTFHQRMPRHWEPSVRGINNLHFISMAIREI